MFNQIGNFATLFVQSRILEVFRALAEDIH